MISLDVCITCETRLLIFLLAILIPTCDSSCPAFHMMYSAYKLNKEKVKVKVAQSYLTLCNPLDCSPWNSPGETTGVGSLSLLQRIFLTQELNWGLLHCRWILYQLSYQGSPLNKEGDNIQPCHTPFPILSQLEYKLILFGEAV